MGQNQDDFDVLAGVIVIGHIVRADAAAPLGTPWMWTLAYGHHEDRAPAHGYEPRGCDGCVCQVLATAIGPR